jgi:high-affinity Fe2+/Pb2+ permease
VGALVAGGYAGYAVSWLGSEAELAHERMLRSALAAVAAGLVTLGGVLLERACRVRKDPEES